MDIAPRRALGRTGFVATALGAGDVADRSLSREQCVATLARALDAGLNVVDTAPNYEDGFSEQIVGEAVRGRRDGLFVISKIDHLQAPVRPQVEASLVRLQLPCTDAFVFHNVRTAADWEQVRTRGLDEAQAAIDAGLSRFRGISSHHPDVLAAALDDGRCDLLLFPVGPFVDARYVDEILPRARRKNVGTVCFKTFGAGKLLGDTSGYNQPLQQRPRGKLSSGRPRRRTLPRCRGSPSRSACTSPSPSTRTSRSSGSASRTSRTPPSRRPARSVPWTRPRWPPCAPAPPSRCATRATSGGTRRGRSREISHLPARARAAPVRADPVEPGG